jgi:hypothetical protein
MIRDFARFIRAFVSGLFDPDPRDFWDGEDWRPVPDWLEAAYIVVTIICIAAALWIMVAVSSI